jgi:hypothetical protein
MRCSLRRYAPAIVSFLALAVGCAAMVAPELVLSSASDSGLASKGLPKSLRWDASVVRVVVVRDANWTQERQDRAFEGFRQWREHISETGAPRFVLLTSPVPAGEIVVRFVPDHTLRSRSVGLTRWRHSGGKINRASIQLAFRDVPGDETRQRSTAAHELGHALGITEHSGHREDLMYYSSVGKTVSSADAARLSLSYR